MEPNLTEASHLGCFAGLRLKSPAIAGILNVSPDSFSDGGQLTTAKQVVAQARLHVAGGATLLDLGAESTRPGFTPVDADEEWARLAPALAALRMANLPAAISIDTRRAAVAQRCLDAGAHIINDVSALADPDMAATVARMHAVIVLMHGFAASSPRLKRATSSAQPDDLDAIADFLQRARDRAIEAGIREQNIWLDPGIGFGKGTAQNLHVTAELEAFLPLGCPLYYAPSRKRFLGEVAGHPNPRDRDAATAAICAIAVAHGASLVRVHAPAQVRDAVRVGAAVRRAALAAK